MGTSPARTSPRRTIPFCGCSHEFLAATQPTRFGRCRSPSSSEIHACRNTRSRRPRPPRSALSGVGPVSASLLWPRRRDIDADKPRPLDGARDEARLARLVEELLHHIEESLVALFDEDGLGRGSSRILPQVEAVRSAVSATCPHERFWR